TTDAWPWWSDDHARTRANRRRAGLGQAQSVLLAAQRLAYPAGAVAAVAGGAAAAAVAVAAGGFRRQQPGGLPRRRRLLGVRAGPSGPVPLRVLPAGGALARQPWHCTAPGAGAAAADPAAAPLPPRLAAGAAGLPAGGLVVVSRWPGTVGGGHRPLGRTVPDPGDRRHRHGGRAAAGAAAGPGQALPAAGGAGDRDGLHRVLARAAAHHRAGHGLGDAAAVPAERAAPGQAAAGPDRRGAVRRRLHGGSHPWWLAGGASRAVRGGAGTGAV